MPDPVQLPLPRPPFAGVPLYMSGFGYQCGYDAAYSAQHVVQL